MWSNSSLIEMELAFGNKQKHGHNRLIAATEGGKMVVQFKTLCERGEIESILNY